MNKNFRVITINGIRGVIVAAFLVFGLTAGFIISPGWVCMQAWNYIFRDSSVVALMNICQGVMFWVAIALSLYALNNKKMLIGFGSYRGLTPEQIKDIMQRAKDFDLEQLKKDEEHKSGLSDLSSYEDCFMKQDTEIKEEDTNETVK